MSDVSVRSLKKDYAGKMVLNGIDLEVQEGELVVLLGPSGCGKTTLLRCLAGLEEISEGELHIRGTKVDAPAEGAFVPPNKRGIGVVFQSYALWPHMTVRANVSYALKIAKEKPAQIKKYVDDALKSLNIYERANEYAGQLSGGQQQRVALARAIASQPKLMLFDEPLSNLDAKLRLKVRLDIRKLHRRSGITAVYVTHDQEEAMALADRIAVMNQGEIQQLGTPEEVFNRPVNAFVADFMGFENIIDGHVTKDGTGVSIFTGLDGNFKVPLGETIGEFTKVIALRAADLLYADKGEANGGELIKGKLLTYTYLGTHTEMLVEVAGKRLFARLTEEQRLAFGTPERGDEVFLRYNLAKVVGLADESVGLEDTNFVPINI